MSNRLVNYAAFAVLTLLWLAFGAALILNPNMLEAAWQSFRGWPVVGQILTALLTLPVIAGLWVWQSAWPLLLRLALVAGLAWVTVYTFWPGRAPKNTVASI